MRNHLCTVSRGRSGATCSPNNFCVVNSAMECAQPTMTAVPQLGCISDLAAFVSGSVKYRDGTSSVWKEKIIWKKTSMTLCPKSAMCPNIYKLNLYSPEILEGFQLLVWLPNQRKSNVLFPHGRPTSSFVSAGHFTFALDLWNPVPLAERKIHGQST